VEEIIDPMIKVMDKDYFEIVAASSSETAVRDYR
jgi:hypothetical protein